MSYATYIRWNQGYAYSIVPTATESHAAYPVSNLSLEKLSKCWRSNGGLSSINLNIDLGAAHAIDIVGILNHNLTSGATITVKAGTTSGVSDYSQSMTWREGSAYKLTSGQNYRYWRVAMTDASNPDSFLEVGNLLIGALSAQAKIPAMDPGFAIERISSNLVVESEFGSPSVDFINDRKRISFAPRNMGTSEASTFNVFVDALREELNPLFLIPDDSIYDGWYCRKQGSTTTQRQFYTNSSLLTFLEDGSGKRMGA